MPKIKLFGLVEPGPSQPATCSGATCYVPASGHEVVSYAEIFVAVRSNLTLWPEPTPTGATGNAIPNGAGDWSTTADVPGGANGIYRCIVWKRKLVTGYTRYDVETRIFSVTGCSHFVAKGPIQISSAKKTPPLSRKGKGNLPTTKKPAAKVKPKRKKPK